MTNNRYQPKGETGTTGDPPFRCDICSVRLIVDHYKDLARQIVLINQSDCVLTISQKVAELAEVAQQLLKEER